MVSFYVFLFCLFATYGVYLVVTRKSAAQRLQMQERLAEVLIYSSGAQKAEFKLAREELMSEIPTFNRWLIKLQSATELKRMIDQADLQLTVMRLFMFSAIAGFLAVIALSSVTVNLLAIAGGGLLAATIPFLHIMYKRRQRLDKFLADLPEALDLMARALSAGHAFTERWALFPVKCLIRSPQNSNEPTMNKTWAYRSNSRSEIWLNEFP